ncbi:MAG: secondary thiamine-phosphate synthase enzyme YjbQ [Euryarchaeota archaeon]|nr:secondary thiamine-phosphate synthase enzyme YjbQ [Euryarchaeota archaeon]MEA3298266.1 secondary thiamine-phosphate synthase enzyme YjbQ [Chloroflexota bacterium]
MERIEIRTKESTELIDITREVKGIVSSKRVDSGVCVIFTKHTTTGIVINENEAGLKSDILTLLNELIPTGKGYLHDRIDNNAHSHLRAVVLGSSVTIPIEGGTLALGTWQSILFVECDGPRRREVCVVIIEG